MRKADWKESGYIFIPVFLEEDSDPEEIINNSDFGTVWEVLQAMLDQDQRMQGVVSKMRIIQGKGEEGSQAWKDAMTEYAEKIVFNNLPSKIDQKRFIERLNTRIVEIIGRPWDFWYGLTLRYKDEFNDPNAPAYYKTAEGYLLGSWQSHQKNSYKNGKLSLERIGRLEKIGFTWDPYEEQFKKGFQETLLHKERTGNPNVQQNYKTDGGYRLGAWQNTKRDNYKKGKLSPDRIDRLEKIGFKWEKVDEKFETGFLETLLYKEITGNPNASATHKTSEGYLLGSWQSTQKDNYKKGKLSPDRIDRLEKIGFKWLIHEDKFEKGFQETLRYKESTGNSNAPRFYETAERYQLGEWQGTQRVNFRKGDLSLERVKRLEEIGFKLGTSGNSRITEILEENFEKGFQQTLLYKESTGNPNASLYYKTSEGYWLSDWQINLRNFYKKGILSSDQTRRLEEIGFKWDLLEQQFEKGYQQTLLYKESTGNSNALKTYKTEEGFLLGNWQSNQRVNYKEDNLSPERIKRLEDIGFKWKLEK